MLARFKMYRGPRPRVDPLPQGIRQDTRMHTRHCLRPPGNIVAEYLAHPGDAAWQRFSTKYINAIEERFAHDRTPFDRLARLATDHDIYLGCSCPTRKNPRVDRCHTVLALHFMQDHYEIDVKLP